MTTEYRPGIPSHAHIEAATRLGLEWEEGRHSNRRWRFEMRGDELWCDFCSDVSEWELDLEPLSSGRITDRADIEQRSFRPIRPYGTPVDWETLDAEVARVAGAAQPQGFRADLWRRICEACLGHLNPVERSVTLSDIESINETLIWRMGSAGLIRYGECWILPESPARFKYIPWHRRLARRAIDEVVQRLQLLVDGPAGEDVGACRARRRCQGMYLKRGGNLQAFNIDKSLNIAD
jgi:hypothetical protein